MYTKDIEKTKDLHDLEDKTLHDMVMKRFGKYIKNKKLLYQKQETTKVVQTD